MGKQAISSDVTVELGGEEVALKCSMAAATAVSSRFGGIQGALSAVSSGELTAAQFIVRQGVPLKQVSNKDLNELVYDTGLGNLYGPLTRYVLRLFNGGRDPSADAEEEADDDAEDEADEGNGEG